MTQEGRMRRSQTAVCTAVLGLILIALARPASAQSFPRAEFSAGWKLLRAIDASIEPDADETLPVGWYADIAGNVSRTIAIVGEVGGAYKNFDRSVTEFGIPVNVTADLKVHTFMGGVRFSRRTPRVVPFGQVLFGLARGTANVKGTATVLGRIETFSESDSSNEFALDAGGGVNLRLTN